MVRLLFADFFGRKTCLVGSGKPVWTLFMGKELPEGSQRGDDIKADKKSLFEDEGVQEWIRQNSHLEVVKNDTPYVTEYWANSDCK